MTGRLPGPIAVLWAAAALGCAQSAAAQQPESGIHPAEIHVGDVFRAIVRVEVPARMYAAFPDTISGATDIESAGRLEVRTDTTPAGVARVLAAYPLTAWRPGAAALPPLEFEIVGDGGSRTVWVAFPEFEITSVLPPDTAGIEPRDLKDVFGGERAMWPWLLGLVLLGVALAAALWLYRRRMRTVVGGAVPRLDARVAALAALSEQRGVRLAGMGEIRRLYIELADTLRYFIAVEAPALSPDLTTTELLPRLPAVMPTEQVVSLRTLLHHADLVKFARSRPAAEQALADWRAARRLVEEFAPITAQREFEPASSPEAAA